MSYDPSKRSERYYKSMGYTREERALVVKHNKEHRNKRNKQLREERRMIVLLHYGGKCACCGEAENKFLSIDHVKGGGTKHRKEIGKYGSGFYAWIIKNNFPDGFQVLCHNCNLAKGYYGICPHKIKVAKKWKA